MLSKKSLLLAGVTFLGKKLADELNIWENLKKIGKNQLFYTITVDNNLQHKLYSKIEEYLMENYNHKINSTTILTNSLEQKTNKQSKKLRQVTEDIQQLVNIDSSDYEQYNLNLGINNCGIYITWNNHRIFVEVDRKEDINKSNNELLDKTRIHLTILKKSKEVLIEFLMELIGQINIEKEEKHKISIYTSDYVHWDELKSYTPTPMEKVFIRKSIKDDYLRDLNQFLSNKQWYINRNIPYNRTYLINGAPRNGKSSLIIATARLLKRNIYTININNYENDTQFIRGYSRIPDNSIIFFEDFDTNYNQREPLNDCKVSFSCILNVLSGVYEKENVIVFITTNFIEKLDKALIGSRRVNKIIEIPLPNKEEAELYISDLYEMDLKLNNYIEVPHGQLLDMFEDNLDNPQNFIKSMDVLAESKDVKIDEPKIRLKNTSISPNVLLKRFKESRNRNKLK